MNVFPSTDAALPGFHPGGAAVPGNAPETPALGTPRVTADAVNSVTVPVSVAGATELLALVLGQLRDEAARALAEERAAARDTAGAGQGVLDWGGGLQGVLQPDGATEGVLDPAKARRHERILRDLAAVEGLARHVDAARVWAAGRVDEASAREYGSEGLARQQNFRSAGALTASVTGISERTARQRIRLAKRTRTATNLLGEPVPGPFPAISAALDAGELGTDAAEVIVAGLSRVTKRIGASEQTAAAERELVALAGSDTGGLRHSAEEMARLTEHAVELLDPDGAAPDEAERRQKRFLRLTPLADGMTRLTGLLDPESAAIMTALVTPTERERAKEWAEHQRAEETRADAHTTPNTGTDTGIDTGTNPDSGSSAESGVRFQPVTAHSPSSSDADPTPDDRTPAQRTLDRLIDGIRAHLAERNAGLATGASTLVNIHVSAETLQDGTGPSWADGIFAPLSAETALRELCDGKYAITVFGTTGAVLAQGRAQRLFTPAQKLALAARDGGCVWPGCDAPPTDCDAHHVIPWSEHHLNGPTDVKNGVLLCRFHHRRIHEHARDGLGAEHRWTIRMIRELPHLIPPVRLDWNRTPRPLGRRRTGRRRAGSRSGAGRDASPGPGGGSP